MCVNTSLYFSSIHIYLSLSYYLFVILYSILSKMDVPLWECNFDFVGQFQLSSVRLKLSQQSSRQERRAVFFLCHLCFWNSQLLTINFRLRLATLIFFMNNLSFINKSAVPLCSKHYSPLVVSIFLQFLSSINTSSIHMDRFSAILIKLFQLKIWVVCLHTVHQHTILIRRWVVMWPFSLFLKHFKMAIKDVFSVQQGNCG